jgi:hypothetical protein
MMRKHVAPVVAAAVGVAHLLSALAQAPTGKGVSIESLNFRPTYFDKDQNPLRSGSLPRTVLFRVPLIAGDISGTITNPPVVSLTAQIGEVAKLELEQIRMKVDQFATTLTRRASDTGLVIDPRETRIARLATAVYDKETGKSIGGTVFRGDKLDENILVVYFDRPCELTGKRKVRDGEVIYNVKVGNAGFHLLKNVKETSTVHRVTVASTPQHISLSIVPTSELRK